MPSLFQNNVIKFHKNGIITYHIPKLATTILENINDIFFQSTNRYICYMNTDRQSNPYVQLCMFLFQNTNNFIPLRQLIEIKFNDLKHKIQASALLFFKFIFFFAAFLEYTPMCICRGQVLSFNKVDLIHVNIQETQQIIYMAILK